jgi:hypothetical protein
LLIIPGNRRIRIFDFTSGTTRAVLKSGFDCSAIEAEIDVRADGKIGPFLPITAYGDDRSWFEEAIFDGFPLARCPPWHNRLVLEQRALELLDGWARKSLVHAPVDAFVRGVEERIREPLVVKRFPFPCGVLDAVDLLATHARRLDEVVLAPSHGDCQPGNILVSRNGRDVTFVDWEYQGLRAENFDRLVLGLKSRSPSGLARRALKFVYGGESSQHLRCFDGRGSWRMARTALFALEELEVAVSGCITAPFIALPEHVGTLCEEVCMFASQVSG